MMNKVICVIVPVYNVEQYLDQCINSILEQTYKNLEIILVDDGSTDKSGIMCDQYAKIDNRIKVIHKNNGGLSDARNAGMKVATGDYIAFVDSDDFISTDMYKVLAELIEQNDADIAIANWCGFYNGKEVSKERTGKILIFEEMETLEFLIYGKNNYKISLSVWDRLYRREIVKDFSFPKGRCYEDVVWSTKVFYKAKKSVYIDRNLYYYRRRNDSIVGLDNNEGVSERVITDEIPQVEAQITFLKSIKQYEMADEVTFFLYQMLLSYYTRCYYDKSKLQNNLLELINKYRVWARDYLYRCNSFYNKCLLIVSLHAFKLLILVLHVKQGRVKRL